MLPMLILYCSSVVRKDVVKNYWWYEKLSTIVEDDDSTS